MSAAAWVATLETKANNVSPIVDPSEKTLSTLLGTLSSLQVLKVFRSEQNLVEYYARNGKILGTDYREPEPEPEPDNEKKEPKHRGMYRGRNFKL